MKIPHPPAPSPPPLGLWVTLRSCGDGEGEDTVRGYRPPRFPAPFPLHRRRIRQLSEAYERWRGVGGEVFKRFLPLLALFALFIVSTSQGVQAADVDLVTYIQRLTAARDALMQGQNQSGAQ